MVYITEFFDSEKEAVDYHSWYLNRYHPAGYGTFLKVTYHQEYDKWIVSGSRYSSCD